MKNSCTCRLGITVFVLLLSASLFGTARTPAGSGTTTSRTASVGGVKLHDLTAGHGPAVILLHGHTQTSCIWKPIIPQLAEKFTVIAPDLPSIGDSDTPADGLDMKTRCHPHPRAGQIFRYRKSGPRRSRHRG